MLTVPASFDAAARELTRAAREAGLAHVTLLEEPQAAFYAWLAAQRRRLARARARRRPRAGLRRRRRHDRLHADRGRRGGRRARARPRRGRRPHPARRRQHGPGARATAAAAARRRRPPARHRGSCSSSGTSAGDAKEQLLGDRRADAEPGHGPRPGPRADRRHDQDRAARATDVEALLVDGFFPMVGADARPRAPARASACRSSACPTPPMPAITGTWRGSSPTWPRTASSRASGCGAARADWPRRRTCCSTAASSRRRVLRDAVVEVLDAWLVADGFAPLGAPAAERRPRPRGRARRRVLRAGAPRAGVRIRGGTARAYYIGIETAMPAVPGFAPPIKALCVVPFGMEEGTEATICRARVRPGRRRAGGVPLPRLRGAQADTARHAGRGLGRRDRRAAPLEVTLTLPGREHAVVPVRLEST